MKLDELQKEYLSGKLGNSAKKMMELLITIGQIYGAKRLIKVSSVQIAGVSYDNIGEEGLQFIEDVARDGKVSVKATLNPAGMDLENWGEMGIKKEFAEKQLRIISAFRKIGAELSCSCVPYLIGNIPKRYEHIAWSESSAVCFANSVIGARTNREGGITALASAITGFTPEYGMHLEVNRLPCIKVCLDLRDIEPLYPGVLGSILGEKLRNQIPYIVGPKPTLEQLKELSASIATYGGTSMFYWEGISEEVKVPTKELILNRKDFETYRERLKGDKRGVELVALGCPHATIEELKEVRDLLRGRKVKIETWISTARKIFTEAKELGIVEEMKKSGIKIFCDTCFVVAPIRGKFKKIATNSAKALYYIQGKLRSETYYGTTEELVEIALNG